MTKRAAATIEMRRTSLPGMWVFPAPTKSGHINQSSTKKQHAKACKLSAVQHFVPCNSSGGSIASVVSV
jgi:hypothetical protein